MTATDRETPDILDPKFDFVGYCKRRGLPTKTALCLAKSWVLEAQTGELLHKRMAFSSPAEPCPEGENLSQRFWGKFEPQNGEANLHEKGFPIILKFHPVNIDRAGQVAHGVARCGFRFLRSRNASCRLLAGGKQGRHKRGNLERR